MQVALICLSIYQIQKEVVADKHDPFPILHFAFCGVPFLSQKKLETIGSNSSSSSHVCTFLLLPL